MSRLLTLLLLTGCQTKDSGSPQSTPTNGSGDNTNEGNDTSSIDLSWDVPALGAAGIIAHPHDVVGSIIVVEWDQGTSADLRVEFEVDAGEWRSTPSQQLDAGEHASFLLLGVPFDHTIQYRLADETQTSEAQSVETDPWPEGLPETNLIAATPEAWVADDRFLLTSVNASTGGWRGGDYWKVIVDRQGRTVWAMLTPDERWSIYLRVSRDGNDILWDEATYWSDWDGGMGSVVHRMKIDGTLVETVETPGMHHAFIELEDEELVWGAADGYLNENLLARKGAGEIEQIWSCQPYHQAHNSKAACQSNTLFWNEAADTFFLSFYTTSTIIEIDHQTGMGLRHWGELPDSLGFSPVESQFSWQHGVNITDTGTMLLSTHSSDDTEEIMVREYTVDPTSGTLEQVWSYGDGKGIIGDTAGEAHRLANGNTLHNCGSAGRVREITPEGEEVWVLEWPHDGQHRLIGRSVFLNNLYDFAP